MLYDLSLVEEVSWRTCSSFKI